jgi:hypothetical protein
MGFNFHGLGIHVPNVVDNLVDKGRNLANDAKVFATHLAGAATEKAVDTAVATVEKVGGVLPKGTVTHALGVAETGIDFVSKPVVKIAGKDSNIGNFFDSISQINFQGATDTTGLKGDWGKFWNVWFFEQRPESLGKWEKGVTVDGEVVDRVTITDPSYTGDLASRQNQVEATKKFNELYPDPKDGDTITVLWQYTGPGTSEKGIPYHLDDEAQPSGIYLASGGHYGALESYTGSYKLTITCHVDPKTGVKTLENTVTNGSDWESGTRVPGVGQRLHLPEYLVPNQAPGEGAHVGGSFMQQFVWTTTLPQPAQATGTPPG